MPYIAQAMNVFVSRAFSHMCTCRSRGVVNSARDKIGITSHIMMHQVLYNVHVTLFIGQLHNI